MKFRSDEQRKAVFANLFNRGGKKSKVSANKVSNFEIKSTRLKEFATPKETFVIRGQKVKMGDLKTKSQREFCSMCKGRDLKMKSGKCKQCIKEQKRFEKEQESFRVKVTGTEMELIEKLLGIHEDWMISSIDDMDDEISEDDFETVWEYHGAIEEATDNEEVRIQELYGGVLSKLKKKEKLNEEEFEALELSLEDPEPPQGYYTYELDPNELKVQKRILKKIVKLKNEI